MIMPLELHRIYELRRVDDPYLRLHTIETVLTLPFLAKRNLRSSSFSVSVYSSWSINPRPDGPLVFSPPDGGLRTPLSNSAPGPRSDTR